MMQPQQASKASHRIALPKCPQQSERAQMQFGINIGMEMATLWSGVEWCGVVPQQQGFDSDLEENLDSYNSAPHKPML